LILHAEVEEVGIPDPYDALVQIVRRQPVGRLQPKIVRQEREMMLIARAKDDGIDHF